MQSTVTIRTQQLFYFYNDAMNDIYALYGQKKERSYDTCKLSKLLPSLGEKPLRPSHTFPEPIKTKVFRKQSIKTS